MIIDKDAVAGSDVPVPGIDRQHADMVSVLAKPGVEILGSLTPEKCDLWHHATGAIGEVGELVDAIKKHVIYNDPLDLVNVLEELGDLEFYLAGIRANLNIHRDASLVDNMLKLAKRYPGYKYTDSNAQRRLDKIAVDGIRGNAEGSDLPDDMDVGDTKQPEES